MKVRELRAKVLGYLVAGDEEKYVPLVVEQYWKADNFNNRKVAVSILANTDDSRISPNRDSTANSSNISKRK